MMLSYVYSMLKVVTEDFSRKSVFEDESCIVIFSVVFS